MIDRIAGVDVQRALFMNSLLQTRIAPPLRPETQKRQIAVCRYGFTGVLPFRPTLTVRFAFSRRLFVNNSR
jgi:hypothetical protein